MAGFGSNSTATSLLLLGLIFSDLHLVGLIFGRFCNLIMHFLVTTVFVICSKTILLRIIIYIYGQTCLRSHTHKSNILN